MGRATRRPTRAPPTSHSSGPSSRIATCCSSTSAARASRGGLDCRVFRKDATHYADRAATCARELGPTRDLYDTHQAVEDLADVLAALDAGRIDLYGDSYGTYFAQTFALWHPERLRSLVLDGAYPVPGTDPAYRDLAEAMRRAFRLTCRRRAACARLGIDPVRLIARFVRRVRARPLVGVAPNGDGTLVRVRVDERTLAATAGDGYLDIGVYRDLVGAIRSAERGDDAPILRLVAENVADVIPGTPARSFSEALYLAVTCHDYPQMWDVAAPLAARRAQFARFVAGIAPAETAPFAPAIWANQDYEGAAACLKWPAPTFVDPVVPPSPVYPDVPTLVLNGDLDSITASSGARVVARAFPRSWFVETENTVHISALGDRDDCAAPIVRRFLRRHDPGNVGCTKRIAEVRTIPLFPRSLAAVPPAARRPGDGSRRRDRRLAAAAAMTVADVIERWLVNYSGTDRGLRGGTWSYVGTTRVTFTLRGTAFVPGVPVSGTVGWNTLTGSVDGRVTATTPGGRRAALRLRWSMQGPARRAALTGRVDGRPLRATTLAP